MDDPQNIKWYAITNYHPKNQLITGSEYGDVTWAKWCRLEVARINVNPDRRAMISEQVNKSKVEKCCVMVNVTLVMERFEQSRYGQRNII